MQFIDLKTQQARIRDQIDNNVKKKDLEQVLQQINIDKAKFSILMYHSPVELKTLSQAGLDLVLSGHTHSGQIFPFNYIARLFHKPLSGLHKNNNTYQYITSGTGTWGPRMRLGSRSEIVLLEIRKEIFDSPNQSESKLNGKWENRKPLAKPST